MSQVSKYRMSPKIESKVFGMFINSIKNTKTSDEVVDFLNDLLSPTEKIMLAKRVSIAFLLFEDKYTYEDISKVLKVSRGTIAKVHSVLISQGKGFKKILGNILQRKIFKNTISEIFDLLTPLPPKGTSIGYWRNLKTKEKINRGQPL